MLISLFRVCNNPRRLLTRVQIQIRADKHFSCMILISVRVSSERTEAHLKVPQIPFSPNHLVNMRRSEQTSLLGSELHLETEPHLISAAMICLKRANYLGPASRRGFASVMVFICILNSCVTRGSGALRRHLSLSKHMDTGWSSAR